MRHKNVMVGGVSPHKHKPRVGEETNEKGPILINVTPLIAKFERDAQVPIPI